MNTTRNSSENFTELVFENKNKAYGAYAIRKSYTDNVTFSLLLSTLFFGILALLAIWFTNNKVEIPKIDVNQPPIITSIIEVVMPEKDIVPKKIEKKIEPAPKTESGQMKASDDPKDGLEKTTEQMAMSKNPNPNGSDSTELKDPGIATIIVKKVPPPIILVADKMPFMKNMQQFISGNLKYPRTAVENGTNGIVYVTFVVETDGSISDIKLLKGIGDGCEQEAMRVVESMPKWEPGIFKGQPARVQCNLPIYFRLK